MYLVPVEIKKSKIEGRGVFSRLNIPKGAIVWRYKKGHDHVLSKLDFNALPQNKKNELRRVGYLSETTDRFIYPPADDPACYTNHSSNNNTAVVYDSEISEEPIFVANRDINKGEEITNDYREFDEFSRTDNHNWL